MSKEKEVEKLKRLIKCGYLDIDSSIIEAINYISQENEKLKEKNKELIADKCIYKDTSSCKKSMSLQNYVELNNYISKNELKEILGIEDDVSNEIILSLIQTIVDENNRLEDIEDKKVQIEYNNVFNKGVKSVEAKIKEKIEELFAEMDELNDEYDEDAVNEKRTLTDIIVVLKELLKGE